MSSCRKGQDKNIVNSTRFRAGKVTMKGLARYYIECARAESISSLNLLAVLPLKVDSSFGMSIPHMFVLERLL